MNQRTSVNRRNPSKTHHRVRSELRPVGPGSSGRMAGVDQQRLVKLSKRLSKVLRHEPARAGLTLDEGGWIPEADLLAALRIGRIDLDAVVAGNDKRRFAIERGSDGVERIRASQGHSVPVDL